MDAVYTFCQAQGRGQGGNRWFGGEGKNLAVTFLFEPRFLEARHLFFLNMALSLGVLRHARSNGEGFSLKWPNDLFWQQRKAGGLLLEASVCEDFVERIRFGVGLNVNETVFPDSLPRAVSLFMTDGKTRNLEREVRMLSESVYANYVDFKASYAGKTFGKWRQEYLSALLFKDRWRDYVFRGQEIRARIEGVDDYGCLELEVSDGSFVRAGFKELRYGFDE